MRRRQRALHLVEDHSLVTKSALGVSWILELEANAFLLEGVLGQEREKSGVEVDEQEVEIVLGVAGAERIRGCVRARQGIHEGRERPSGHGEERVADGKALGPRKHDVLEYVSHAGRVHRHGRKGHRERVVVVSALDVNVLGPGALVDQLDERALETIEWLAPDDRVTANRVHTTRADSCQSHPP